MEINEERFSYRIFENKVSEFKDIARKTVHFGTDSAVRQFFPDHFSTDSAVRQFFPDHDPLKIKLVNEKVETTLQEEKQFRLERKKLKDLYEKMERKDIEFLRSMKNEFPQIGELVVRSEIHREYLKIPRVLFPKHDASEVKAINDHLSKYFEELEEKEQQDREGRTNKVLFYSNPVDSGSVDNSILESSGDT